MNPDVLPGQSFPLGTTVYPGGVNFCVFSKNCEALELLLFDDADDPQPARVIRLDPERNKTFYYWHVSVSGIGAGQLYGYRAYGPFAPEQGHRFDGMKVLLDPYAQAVVVGANYAREAAARPGDNCAHALKGVVVDPSTYDWEGDVPLRLPYADSVIYELHVRGFTRHPNSGISPAKRGTYAGLLEKIPYLKALEVTAVEETRIYPRSSAFEALLAKVYIELWELQDNPRMFANRVETFVSVFLPTMFQTRIRDEKKFPGLSEKLDEMKAKIETLKQAKTDADPFTVEAIDDWGIPTEEMEFAREVWHAVVDVLTDAGFNFPMAKEAAPREMGRWK